jgi:hypothetical protein
MEVKYVFADDDEFMNTLEHQCFRYIAFKVHDVVVEQVVPFANHFDNGVSIDIIRIQYLYEEGLTTHRIPLWVDVVIINFIAVFEFRIFLLVKRTPRIFARNIEATPVIIWFKVVHKMLGGSNRGIGRVEMIMFYRFSDIAKTLE